MTLIFASVFGHNHSLLGLKIKVIGLVKVILGLGLARIVTRFVRPQSSVKDRFHQLSSCCGLCCLIYSFGKADQSDESADEQADEAENSSDAGDSEVDSNESREVSDASEHDSDDDDDGDDDATDVVSDGETEEVADDKTTSSTFHAGNYWSHVFRAYICYVDCGVSHLLQYW